jgi:hypothetical protein
MFTKREAGCARGWEDFQDLKKKKVKKEKKV